MFGLLGGLDELGAKTSRADRVADEITKRIKNSPFPSLNPSNFPTVAAVDNLISQLQRIKRQCKSPNIWDSVSFNCSAPAVPPSPTPVPTPAPRPAPAPKVCQWPLVLDKATNQCVSQACPPGMYLDPSSGICLPVSNWMPVPYPMPIPYPSTGLVGMGLLGSMDDLGAKKVIAPAPKKTEADKVAARIKQSDFPNLSASNYATVDVLEKALATLRQNKNQCRKPSTWDTTGYTCVQAAPAPTPAPSPEPSPTPTPTKQDKKDQRTADQIANILKNSDLNPGDYATVAEARKALQDEKKQTKQDTKTQAIADQVALIISGYPSLDPSTFTSVAQARKAVNQLNALMKKCKAPSIWDSSTGTCGAGTGPTPAPGQCVSPQIMVNGVCVSPAVCTSPLLLNPATNQCYNPNTVCTAPLILDPGGSGVCVNPGPGPGTCTPPQIWTNNQCIDPRLLCTSPQYWNGTTCVAPPTPYPPSPYPMPGPISPAQCPSGMDQYGNCLPGPFGGGGGSAGGGTLPTGGASFGQPEWTSDAQYAPYTGDDYSGDISIEQAAVAQSPMYSGGQQQMPMMQQQGITAPQIIGPSAFTPPDIEPDASLDTSGATDSSDNTVQGFYGLGATGDLAPSTRNVLVAAAGVALLGGLAWVLLRKRA